MYEKIKLWIDAWKGARKWTLHMFVAALIQWAYMRTDDAAFLHYVVAMGTVAISFGASNSFEWYQKFKLETEDQVTR